MELRAPRTDGDAVLVVWIEQGLTPTNGSEWARAVARFYGGALVHDVRLSLAGAEGHLARMRIGGEEVWRGLVASGAGVVHIEARCPDRFAEQYWMQVETMLATWVWID
jgi:hypothetical protein